jgi:hypothetical protein
MPAFLGEEHGERSGPASEVGDAATWGAEKRKEQTPPRAADPFVPEAVIGGVIEGLRLAVPPGPRLVAHPPILALSTDAAGVSRG